MSNDALQFITELMETLEIPYAFQQWNDEKPSRYWVGSAIEPVSLTRDEDGRQDTTLTLQGYSRDWMLLNADKEQLERHASQTAILPDGTGIAVSYGGGDIVPVGDSDITSMKINLEIQEWRVI